LTGSVKEPTQARRVGTLVVHQRQRLSLTSRLVCRRTAPHESYRDRRRSQATAAWMAGPSAVYSTTQTIHGMADRLLDSTWRFRWRCARCQNEIHLTGLFGRSRTGPSCLHDGGSRCVLRARDGRARAGTWCRHHSRFHQGSDRRRDAGGRGPHQQSRHRIHADDDDRRDGPHASFTFRSLQDPFRVHL